MQLVSVNIRSVNATIVLFGRLEGVKTAPVHIFKRPKNNRHKVAPAEYCVTEIEWIRAEMPHMTMISHSV